MTTWLLPLKIFCFDQCLNWDCFFQIEQKLQDNGRYNEGLVLDLHIGQRVDNIREDIQAWFQGTNDGDNQGKQENDESSQGKSVGKHLSFVQDGTEKGKGPN